MVTRNRDEIGGRIEQATGVVKERLGRATGDERLEEQGAADRTAGNVRASFGKARRKIGEIFGDVKRDLNKP